MALHHIIHTKVKEAVKTLYNSEAADQIVQLQQTKREFEGDITLVVFPLLRISGKSPEDTANELGAYLSESVEIIAAFNVIKGFLNLVISDSYYIDFLNSEGLRPDFGRANQSADAELYMVEYSSPNTNKPLHLGHIRNNLLGWSVCRILEASGKKVIKTNIVNDRGIHICKSMLAWLKWGNGETPASAEKKGDHLVGEYYVKFDQEYKKQIQELISQGQTEEDATANAPIIKEAQEMLRKWGLSLIRFIMNRTLMRWVGQQLSADLIKGFFLRKMIIQFGQI
jgi:arginyl-tRNA synthetase